MRHAIQTLLHYSVNTKLTANQKCHACRICLNSLLCFTTTDSLTWQRTELHKKLFNLRHTMLWNNPTKEINTKRVILGNLIEATLMTFSKWWHPFQNSENKTQIAENPTADLLIGKYNRSDFKPPQFSTRRRDFKLKQPTNFEEWLCLRDSWTWADNIELLRQLERMPKETKEINAKKPFISSKSKWNITPH